MAGFQNRTNRRQQTRPRGSFPPPPGNYKPKNRNNDRGFHGNHGLSIPCGQRRSHPAEEADRSRNAFLICGFASFQSHPETNGMRRRGEFPRRRAELCHLPNTGGRVRGLQRTIPVERHPTVVELHFVGLMGFRRRRIKKVNSEIAHFEGGRGDAADTPRQRAKPMTAPRRGGEEGNATGEKSTYPLKRKVLPSSNILLHFCGNPCTDRAETIILRPSASEESPEGKSPSFGLGRRGSFSPVFPRMHGRVGRWKTCGAGPGFRPVNSPRASGRKHESATMRFPAHSSPFSFFWGQRSR